MPDDPVKRHLYDVIVKRWIPPVIYAVLALEVAGIAVFAAVFNSLDFRIYRLGGHAITQDAHLYLDQLSAHWFTYTPFAAGLFAPLNLVPLGVARVLWQLGSVAAFTAACATTLRLAGRRASRVEVAGMVTGGLALEPVWHTFFLGQINLYLLALILFDVWRISRGRHAGVGIGVAAAIKLTPAIFVLLFFLTRRTRSALTAAATFLCCGLAAYIVAPKASRLYWLHLFYDTKRVGASYISNQSPFGSAARLLGGVGHVSGWYFLVPLAVGAAGLTVATALAGRDDWLGAAAATGTTGLLVSPISWTHHWIWIVPALVVLVRNGRRARVAALFAYCLFLLAPMWWTPRSGGSHEYGFHGLVTLVANSYLMAGLIFLAYLAFGLRRIAVEPSLEIEAREKELATIP